MPIAFHIKPAHSVFFLPAGALPFKILHPKPKVESIVFDLDGVLADSGNATKKSLATVLASHGFSASEKQILAATKNGNGAASILVAAVPSLSENPALLKEMVTSLNMACEENCYSIMPTPISETLPAISSSYSLGVATNSSKRRAQAILEHLGILKFFKAVVTLADALPKPSPQMVLLALTMLEAARTSSVFVGDKESDRLAGERAGVKTIMVDATKGNDGCLPFTTEFLR